MNNTIIIKEESYMLSIKEIEHKFETSTRHGLSTKEAEGRLKKYGRNVLPEKKQLHPFLKFLSHLNDVLIYVLVFAAIITSLKGEWVDTIVILLVIVINAFIGFLQEGSAEKSLKNIQKMLSNKAIVVREDIKQEVEAPELVIGDLVMLSPGSKVPADLRLFEVHNLLVEEAMLTGESVSVLKNTETIDKEAGIGDRLNTAFSGTNIISGTAAGIVIATGKDTEIGHINQMISEVAVLRTPLLQQLDKLGKTIFFFLLAMAAVLFAFGFFYRETPIAELSMSMISLMVAMVPEGLPAIVSVVLSFGVKKMFDARSIIRKLPTVETLGLMTVVCSDKTGTLTMNEMTVKNIILADRDYKVTGESYDPVGDILIADTGKKADIEGNTCLNMFLKTVTLCNDSALKQDQEGHWTVVGNVTDGALRVLSLKSGMDILNTERLGKIPFDSKYKYMSTYCSVGADNFVFLTGAPDVLLNLCKLQYNGEKDVEIDVGFWEGKISEYAQKGLRMVAAAYKKDNVANLSHDDIEEGMIFVGIAGIMDPPRPEAVAAIKECQAAGIRVKMITGDHKDTATVIGGMLNIGNGKDAVIGVDLEHMDDDELVGVVQEFDIFARTSPEHKLRIVKALQERDEVVGMTGDGVNDAPALKQAEVGIAMGIKGTEVTKEAADMVITDDNFATIATAVKEGRRVYDNLIKTIWFLLPTNVAQGLLIVISILLGLPAPLSPLQILWINMATSTTLSFGLATELYEKNVMSKPPRDRNVPMLNGFSIWRVFFVGALVTMGAFYLEHSMISKGYDTEFTSTVLLQAIVFMQLAYMFNCRLKYDFSIDRNLFRNVALWIVSVALIGLQMLIIYSPGMQSWFGTAAITPYYWYLSAVLGVVVFVVVEIEKFVVKRVLDCKD